MTPYEERDPYGVEPASENHPPQGRQPGESAAETWLDGLQELTGLWQWDHLAAEIGQESRARILIAGLAGAGKHTLFSRLRGWPDGFGEAEESASPFVEGEGGVDQALLEPYGSFVLATLPSQLNGHLLAGEEILFTLGDPSLVLYLVDAAAGLRPSDYRWIATLRATGRPLVVILNKCDLLGQELDRARAEVERQAGMPVIAISARSGLNIEEQLLPALLDTAPRVAVALGREIQCLRRLAVRRLIRQAALFAGMVGAQPIPLLDIPLQAALQVGLVMRVGAVYGRAPTGGVSREILGTVASSLGVRYLALALVKFVPLFGWAVGGVLGFTMTLLLGEAGIRYYEAGGTLPRPELVDRSQAWLARGKSGVLDAVNNGRGRITRAWPGREKARSVGNGS
jgi:uncharacterized protein (DUF697 family)